MLLIIIIFMEFSGFWRPFQDIAKIRKFTEIRKFLKCENKLELNYANRRNTKIYGIAYLIQPS